MKIFLTGESGILGSDIKGQLIAAGHEVNGYNSTNIQLGNFNNVITRVRDFKPEIVIHCAAMTNVDLCEDEKNAAILTNVIGSQNLSRAAGMSNAKIVYISSCGVYGNQKKSPYNELDVTVPVNYHHFTKLEGEKRIKEHNPNFLIIRPGWLFGGTLQHKKNFVEARRKEAFASPVLQSAVDKVGSPTYTLHVAKQIISLINEDLIGTFNVVNEGFASRFDYVSEIVRLFQFDATVEPVNSNSFPRKANMPDNECLENLNLNLLNVNQMPDWRSALKEYINKTYNS
jgi:dTDP-4-dehydrorhamnose reductase